MRDIEFTCQTDPLTGMILISAGICFKVSQNISAEMSEYINEDHVRDILKNKLLEGIKTFLDKE